VLELFQADGDPAWLAWALDLQRRQDELFWDEQDGGWFSTTGRDASVLLRIKEDYDGAEPAASSVSVLNLLSLVHLTNDPDLSDRLERALATFGGRAASLGRAAPMLLAGLSSYHAGLPQIVVAGDRSAVEPMMTVIRRHYLPTAIVVPVVPGHRESLTRLLPWTEAMSSETSPAVYVCRNFTCERPVETADALESVLSRNS